MKNLDELKEMATDAAQSAARAAKFYAQISKKRLMIAAEQENIRRNYTKLGKVYYKDYITDEEPDDAEYLPLCESVSESYRRINELRDEIDDLKDAYAREKAGEVCPEPEVFAAAKKDVEDEASEPLPESETAPEAAAEPTAE